MDQTKERKIKSNLEFVEHVLATARKHDLFCLSLAAGRRTLRRQLLRSITELSEACRLLEGYDDLDS